MNRKQKRRLIRILIGAALFGAASFISAEGWTLYLRCALFLASYLTVGADICRKAVLGIFRGRVFDENFLMAVATVGAAALATVEGNGDYGEAVAVMLLYQIGELFQSIAVGKSRKNIAALMDIRPDTARVCRGGEALTVSPAEVAVGEEILVYPGEKIPLDGTVLEGESFLDTRALTGESVPRRAAVGDRVQSGTVNGASVLRIRVDCPFGEGTVQRILDLVENAAMKKAKSENFITKFAAVYTPAVCICAAALALLPPLSSLLFGGEPAFGVWIYRALSFLVISCPCALVISIPLSFFAGLGGAGSRGILIKGAVNMETLAKVRTVAFDKTGTLTHGVFEVVKVAPVGMEDDVLLTYAALAESASSHPIAQSIRRAAAQTPDPARVKEITEIGGHGIEAVIDGVPVAFGNAALMEKHGVLPAKCDEPGTLIHAAVGGAYAGYILISDKIKETSADAARDLRDAGVQTLVLLTGDRAGAAAPVAEALGMDRVYSELLPEDKFRIVEGLKDGAAGAVAFVGDGINDAPVLAGADVGIAMGALGSDAAMEAADVVLMDDDPKKVAAAIRHSRKVLRIVYENIVFALGVKLAFLMLSAFGAVGMWGAIFADVGVMVIAVLNAIRSLK